MLITQRPQVPPGDAVCKVIVPSAEDGRAPTPVRIFVVIGGPWCRWVRAQVGGTMNRIERRIRTAVNPMSTAVTRWWCHSAMRHMLTGYGPTAMQSRLIRRGTRGVRFTLSAEQMKARARAIDELLGRDDHEM